MTEKKMRVLVLGYGEMGRALAGLLRPRHEVAVWQRRPSSDMPPVDLEASARDSDVVLFCLPTVPHYALATRLRPVLTVRTCCVTIAKGLDEEGRPAVEIFRQVFGRAVPYAVVYGPMIAEELRGGKPGFAQVGADPGVFQRISRLFHGTRLLVEHTLDQPGIAWAAVLKNVYAMLFGIADELRLGDNMRGYLAVAAMRELHSLLQQLGALSTVPYQLAGLGDLITTATSTGSHHHDLGRRLARGERALTGEGLHTVAMIEKHALFDTRAYPLLHLVAEAARQPEGIEERLWQCVNGASLR